ncbi:MAG: TetR family transcriptional regulator [Rhizobiales bacterium]|nr:TetR family transcriptional regulator [Hyphomicrobiales bacterium]
MTVKARLTPEETRERILVVAEEHFRRVGYAKTAVADIAGALAMSPANVYRFFATKSAICEEIAQRLLAESTAEVRAIAARKTSAADRLGEMVLAIHRYNKSNLTEERRLHDMVEHAMVESWGVIKAYLEGLTMIFADVIREGMVAGEFAIQDPIEAALSFKQAHVTVFHPTLIAHCAGLDMIDDLEEQARRLTRFALRALKA